MTRDGAPSALTLSVLCALPSAQAVATTRGSCCPSTPSTRRRSRASRAADTWPSVTPASRRQPPALVRRAHKPKLARAASSASSPAAAPAWPRRRAAGQRRPLRRLGSRQRARLDQAQSGLRAAPQHRRRQEIRAGHHRSLPPRRPPPPSTAEPAAREPRCVRAGSCRGASRNRAPCSVGAEPMPAPLLGGRRRVAGKVSAR
jgi:hypothetical protein